jgi:hypothetical protein
MFHTRRVDESKRQKMIDLNKELKVNKPMTEEESNEFLKLISHNEYCIVDQLKKTPNRISLISLTLSSKPH